MLTVSRKAGQTIKIDGGITIVIHQIKGNKAIIGIDAPNSTMVLRGELEDYSNVQCSGIERDGVVEGSVIADPVALFQNSDPEGNHVRTHHLSTD